MNPKDMSDMELDNALMVLLGWEKIKEYKKGWYVWKDPTGVTRGDENFQYRISYCSDPAASLDVQEAAVRVDDRMYAINLAKHLKWDEDGDPLSFNDNDLFSYAGVSNFFIATPRQRAEAAYMTLQEVSDHE